MRSLISVEMLNATGVECAGAPDETVHFVALLKQEFGQVGTVLKQDKIIEMNSESEACSESMGGRTWPVMPVINAFFGGLHETSTLFSTSLTQLSILFVYKLEAQNWSAFLKRFSMLDSMNANTIHVSSQYGLKTNCGNSSYCTTPFGSVYRELYQF